MYLFQPFNIYIQMTLVNLIDKSSVSDKSYHCKQTKGFCNSLMINILKEVI